jgi:hypothetical protein
MKIAVDFDGTIVDHRFPEIGSPVPGAFEWLKRLKEAGATLLLYTMRCDNLDHRDVLSEAIAYCRTHGIEFDGINSDPEQTEWTASPKCYADVYIDDAAVGCPLRENPRRGGQPFVDWGAVGPVVMDLIQQRKDGNND